MFKSRGVPNLRAGLGQVRPITTQCKHGKSTPTSGRIGATGDDFRLILQLRTDPVATCHGRIGPKADIGRLCRPKENVSF